MTRITISYKKVTLTEISHACEDNEEHIEEENFDLESHDAEIRADERAKTIDRIINCVALPKSAKKLIKEMAKDVVNEYEKEQKNV